MHVASFFLCFFFFLFCPQELWFREDVRVGVGRFPGRPCLWPLKQTGASGCLACLGPLQTTAKWSTPC